MEARFLRKRLGLTQQELGARIGANKVTISDWERGDSTISEHYDYILRGLVLSSLRAPSAGLLGALRGIHETGKKRKPAPVVVPAFLLRGAKEKTARR